MKSHEHRRSRRPAPVEHAPDPAAAALTRAIMLAHVLRWREEWQAEMAARAAKREGGNANGRMIIEQAPRPRRDGNAAHFAAGIARSEFGRFYWDQKRDGPSTGPRRGDPAQKSGDSKRK